MIFVSKYDFSSIDKTDEESKYPCLKYVVVFLAENKLISKIGFQLASSFDTAKFILKNFILPCEAVSEETRNGCKINHMYTLAEDIPRSAWDSDDSHRKKIVSKDIEDGKFFLVKTLEFIISSKTNTVLIDFEMVRNLFEPLPRAGLVLRKKHGSR